MIMQLYTAKSTVAPGGDCVDNSALRVAPITLSILLLCSFVQLLPSVFIVDLLCFDYYAITEEYEIWRLATGHFVHSSFDHAFWDLVGFSACAWYVESKRSNLVVPTLLLSVTTLSIFLISPLTSIEKYSGISGILYAYLVIACWIWLTDNRGLKGWIPLLIVIGKTLLEIATASNVFANQGWELFYPAHLLGLMTGTIIMMTSKPRAD